MTRLSNAQRSALEYLSRREPGLAGRSPLRWPTVLVLEREGLIEMENVWISGLFFVKVRLSAKGREIIDS